MANYKENFASKLDWAMPFQRTGAFPLDRSNLFESLADAQLYAQGGADKRGLGGTSYVGQMIVVYENDAITAYIINADRSLKEMASTASDGSSVQSVLDALNAHKTAYDAKVKELEAADTALGERLDIIEGEADVEGSIKKALADAKVYADTQDVTLHETISTEIDNDVKVVSDALSGEITRAKAAEKVNADAIATEKTRAEDEEKRIEGLITAEATRATNAEQGLSGKIDIINGEGEGSIKKAVADEATARGEAISGLQGEINTIKSNIGESGTLGAQVKANKEAIAAINDKDNGILAKANKYTDDKLATAVGVAPSETVIGSGLLKNIADAEKSAKGYADQKIAALVNGAPETLDTLKELADALKNDADFATTVSTEIGKKADKTYVDTELGKKVDKVEGSRLVTETEADAWDAKAEVSQVNQALADAKSYTDGKVGDLNTLKTDAKGSAVSAINELKGKIDGINEDLGATGSIGTRLNNLETTVGDEQSGLVKKVNDNADNITTNTNAIAAINNEQTGILAQAKEDATTKANAAKDAAIEAAETKAGELDTALQTKIEGENGVLMTAIKAEQTRATEVEDGLKSKLETVETQVNANKTAIGDAENGLTKKVNDNTAAIANNTTNISSNTAAIATEKTRAEGKEAEIKSLLDAEVTRATEAENSLSGKIDIINGEGEGSFKKAITDEKTARENADKALGDRIAKFEAGGEKDVSKLATDLASEVSRAKGAEESNANAIAAEAELRLEKDNELQGAIDTINENLGATGSIGNRLSVVEGKATALEGRADALEAAVGNEQESTGLYGDIADLKAKDTSLQASIDKLNGDANTTGSVAKTVADAVAGEATLRKAADDKLDERLGKVEASIKDGGALESRVAENERKLGVIQGESEGSIKKALKDANEYTDTAVANLVNSAPEALDTLQELANALGDDPNFATTVATQIGTKVDKVENHRLVSTEEITKWNAKAEVSDVTTEKDRAEAAELELKNAIGAINNANTGILAEAKKYADQKDSELAGNYSGGVDGEGNPIQAKGLRGEIETRIATEKTRAEGVEAKLREDVDKKVAKTDYDAKVAELEQADTDNLATAKSYADTQDTALHTIISSEIDTDVAAEAKLRSDADTALSNRIANKADIKHGNHVPETQDIVSNKVFLRNDNTWAEVTPENIGAAAAIHGTHVTYANELPKAPGKAAAGKIDKAAREDHVHPLQTTITGNAATASKLATARTIAVKGDATGSVSFDGSENKDLNLTLSNSGVATGSYGPTGDVAPNYKETFVVPQVTVDIKGRVTSATNRTITLPAQTVYENATSSKAGLMSNEDKAKLDGIEANANNYTHPESHPASMITESTDKRFVSDAEKAKWDAKETTDGAQSKADTAAANALQSAKKYADDKITTLVNGAPEAMDTLKELADAIDAHQDVYDSYVQTVSTELAKKVDKVEGSRLVSETEIAGWNAKAETSDVEQALSDAKDYTDGEIAKITTGDGSIGARLTAVEVKNTAQDEAITNAQNQADKGVTDAATEKARAEAAEKVLTDNLAAEVTRATNAETANKNAITVLNGDSTVEGSVDKKIADNNIFDTDILTVNPLGGIKAKEDLNGLTIKEVLKKLLYPYVAHLVSASSSPDGGVFECGSTQTVTRITANITKKSEPITKVEFVDDSTVLETKTDGVAAGGQIIYNSPITVSTNKSFIVKVTDKAGTVVEAKTGGFNFVYPYYCGVCVNDAAIDEAMVKGLTKKVETKGNKEVIYNADCQRAVIAYPASYGNIKKILDPNSFDVTATFTKHSFNVTGLDGEPVLYNVYVNGAFTATNFKFTFNIY